MAQSLCHKMPNVTVSPGNQMHVLVGWVTGTTVRLKDAQGTLLLKVRKTLHYIKYFGV